MAYPNHKAFQLALMLQEELAMRLGAAGANISGGVGEVQMAADSMPWFQIGGGSSTNKGGIIKIVQYPWTNAKDILGNTANQYGPLVIQFGEEKHTSVAGASYNTPVELAAILGPVFLKGARVEWYKTTYATVPAVDGTTGLINGTLTASFEGHLQYPLVLGQ